MHYWIDGYNLLFRMSHPAENLQSERAELLSLLANYAEDLEIEITIIFDALHTPDEASRSHFHLLEIIYTNFHESADDYIIENLQLLKKPSTITLVTSDRKLAWHAKRLGAAHLSSENFLSLVKKHISKRKRATKKTQSLQKATKKEKTSDLLSQSPALQAPTETPSSETVFDYYLKLFEQRAKKLEEEKALQPQKKRTSLKKNKFQDDSIIEVEGLTEFQRWLKIFEEKE